LVTGTILTPIIVGEMIDKIADFIKENPSNWKISLIGGAGIMGRSIFLWLTKRGFANNLLVVEASDQEVKHLKGLFPEEEGFRFACTHNIKEIKDSNLVIVATAAPNAIVTQDMLSPNTVIIDDTHPSNVAEDVINTVFRVMAIVPGLRYKFPMDQKEPGEAVTCFAEGILLAKAEEAFIFYEDDPSMPWHKKQTVAMAWMNQRMCQFGNVTSSFKRLR
jgi:predicted amino acid dehydrogenase